MSGATWVALLRGINLGRHKRVAMADLRSLLESLGYDNVRTHLQSGNAIFTAERGQAEELERHIASRIEADLGLDVKVMVRSADELAAIFDGNPFVAQGVDSKELHVVFLSANPPAKNVAAIDADAYAPDEVELADRTIYLRLPNGLQGSRVPDLQNVLGVSATMRNWNTVSRLRELTAG